MFGRWLHSRLKAAENALRQGRVDDVCAALHERDLREHPRGEKLLDALVKPLLARARLHRQAGRFREALADLDQLATLDRATPDVQTLRQSVLVEMQADARETAAQRDVIEGAADHLQAGHLETGRLQVNRIDDTQQREHLAEELDQRVERSHQLLEQAAEALQRDDVLAAIRVWHEARKRHGRTRDLDQFAARLAAACRAAVNRWHIAGRVEHLLAARPAVAVLLDADPTLTDCERLITLCDRAVAQLSGTDYAGLRQTLLRLKAAGTSVAWVNTALDALGKIADGHETLMATPLGLFASDAGRTTRAAQTHPVGAASAPDLAATLDAQALDPDALGFHQTLLMLVDGGGSSLILRSDRVRLGRAGSSATLDVPIPADIESHHADIERRGEDYFLTALGPVQVNRRPIRHTLLRDGDRIVLGGSAKLTFHKPSTKSQSAVLRLSHRCRLSQDVSNVILFCDTCLVGPGGTAHVPTHDDGGQAVLFERVGRLCARQTAGAGHLVAPVQGVVAGQTYDFGGLRLTVKPYLTGNAGC